MLLHLVVALHYKYDWHGSYFEVPIFTFLFYFGIVFIYISCHVSLGFPSFASLVIVWWSAPVPDCLLCVSPLCVSVHVPILCVRSPRCVPPRSQSLLVFSHGLRNKFPFSILPLPDLDFVLIIKISFLHSTPSDLVSVLRPVPALVSGIWQGQVT